jgi:phospholipase C
LPAYSFIEPRYFNFLWKRANDQHPDHDVALGEDLTARVYEAVRSSPNWPNTLLVVTWDEHGGTYDHAVPPTAQPPGGGSSANPPFDFSRYGPRVPAVLISPLIPRRTLDPTVYDHSSLPATVKRLFGLPDFLTRRDAAANTFEGVASLGTARLDTPDVIPRAVRAEHRALTADNVRVALAAGEASEEPLSELQHSLVALADGLQPAPTAELRALRAARVAATEHDAAQHVREAVARFLQAP